MTGQISNKVSRRESRNSEFEKSPNDSMRSGLGSRNRINLLASVRIKRFEQGKERGRWEEGEVSGTGGKSKSLCSSRVGESYKHGQKGNRLLEIEEKNCVDQGMGGTRLGCPVTNFSERNR